LSNVDGLYADAQLQLRVLGDTATAIPELTRLCRERIGAQRPASPSPLPSAPPGSAKRHNTLFAGWAALVARGLDACPSHCRASPH